MQNHASAMSLLDGGEQRCIKVINNNNIWWDIQPKIFAFCQLWEVLWCAILRIQIQHSNWDLFYTQVLWHLCLMDFVLKFISLCICLLPFSLFFLLPRHDSFWLFCFTCALWQCQHNVVNSANVWPAHFSWLYCVLCLQDQETRVNSKE